MRPRESLSVVHSVWRVTSSSSRFQDFLGGRFFQVFCSPGVLVGTDSVGLLAVLGGLLHCVHDLAVLLREGHDPETEQNYLMDGLFYVYEEREDVGRGESRGASGLKPLTGKRGPGRTWEGLGGHGRADKGKC